MNNWLRFAGRNLRSGLGGFWIFLACIILGVSAIAVIGSLADSVDRGLREQGRPLLGGDLEFSLLQRDVTKIEGEYIDTLGKVSRVATMRGMANANGRATLVELKAVDNAYPHYGSLAFGGNTTRDDALGRTSSSHAIAVDPLLLGRLGLKIGDQVKIGIVSFTIGAVIATEPDRISDGIVLGPRILMSHAALEDTGLIQPGSLITWRYRLKLPEGTSLLQAKELVELAEKKFPDSGWRVRASDNAANGAERFVERLSYFMGLVGIASLVIGGAGIGNAVSAFINRRIPMIATMKCLGIDNKDIFGSFFVEILLVALIGIAIGLTMGAMSPWILTQTAGSLLPLPITSNIEWRPLALAAALGLLITLAFALWPLGQIANVSGSTLFRAQQTTITGAPAWGYIIASLLMIAIAASVVLVSFDNFSATAQYLGGLAGSFVALATLAFALTKLLKILPRPKNIIWRHALESLHRPGTASVSIIMALGLGLTLFVTLALTDSTISRELRAGIPEKAPAFFFLDVRNDELETFKKSMASEAGVTTINNAPMMRGRIVKVKGIAADQVASEPGSSWALRGDRGLTYADTLPQGSELVTGKWWDQNYAGPPLVSIVDEIAKGIGVKVGDKLTINVLGREIEATIANTRKVNWRSMGINFVIVFNPSTLKAAPHSHIVTLEMEGGDEAGLLNRAAQKFPSVTAVRVKEALATIGDLLGKMLMAVRGTNALTLVSGVLVLAGALAAGLSARSYEAVVLKTYGATRGQLLYAFSVEYGLIGLVSAFFGIAAGSLGAWYLAAQILELPFVFSLPIAATTALVAMAITIAGGLITTARALSAKPSDYLRNN